MFTKRFKDISRHDADSAGGKGASLGEMSRAGIPVPPGFVVLSEVFEKFIKAAKIASDIDVIFHNVKYQDTASVERVSEKIKGIILDAEIPKDIATEIKSEFKKLRVKFVAVRSSATVEDSASAAWAGQFDSFLNTTEKRLLENVKRCWASLFTPRAISYRFEKRLHEQKISIAVVVQKMIKSEISGVAFSVHPTTQNYNHIIIEASYGLGEAIVSGQITPDSYVIEKQPRRIIERTIQIRKNKAILSDKRIMQLSDLILQIEGHYGFPCDIEWTFEKGKFYVVQSRPITALDELAATDGKFKGKQLSDLEPIEYWAEELTPPLYGITDTKQPPCKDNFLCVYQNNTAILYFINGRDKREAEIGYRFFKRGNSVQEYAKKVTKVLRKQKLLKEKHFSLNALIKVSREFNGVYAMTEEVRLKKFEDVEDEKSWGKFKKIAELRLRMRKELESILYVKSDKALDELAHVNKMKRGDLFFYTYEELQSLLDKHEKVASPTIQDRERGYVYWIKDGKSVLYTGKQFKAISDELRKAHVGKNLKELKGRGVSSGIVRGTVQLVLNNSKNLDAQIRRFKNGMILVTEMTRPKTLMACYRAKAIITDEGGIVSHAAITARELKIPCVVGTKIATKILKDGDIVEVNAREGIIKIIK